jgi:hypothetical protein
MLLCGLAAYGACCVYTAIAADDVTPIFGTILAGLSFTFILILLTANITPGYDQQFACFEPYHPKYFLV